jgi:hypothetical protein
MDIQHILEYLRRKDALYKQRPELKTTDPFGYQCNQELSAIVSVFRFGNLDIVERLTGKLSRKTKKAIFAFRAGDAPEPEYQQKRAFHLENPRKERN